LGLRQATCHKQQAIKFDYNFRTSGKNYWQSSAKIANFWEVHQYFYVRAQKYPDEQSLYESSVY
jgi:hypothetical protein